MRYDQYLNQRLRCWTKKKGKHVLDHEEEMKGRCVSTEIEEQKRDEDAFIFLSSLSFPKLGKKSEERGTQFESCLT